MRYLINQPQGWSNFVQQSKAARILKDVFFVSRNVAVSSGSGGNGRQSIRRILVGEEIDELAGGKWDDTEPPMFCGDITCNLDDDCLEFDEQCTCGYHTESGEFRCFYPSPIADVVLQVGDDDQVGPKLCRTGTCDSDKDCPDVCNCGFSLDFKQFKCFYPSPVADVLQNDDPYS